jgi:Sulfatase
MPPPVARFLVPALAVAGAALAFGWSASDTSDREDAANASFGPKPRLAAEARSPQRLERPDDRVEPAARHSRSPRRPHAILLVLDEFPSDSLLDEQGRIDPVRYPNFAALAAGATWFRNAYSIYDSTTKAVPAILDGRWPRPGTSPDRRYHPRSVFDMFARRGYRLVSAEEATALCPPSLCRGGRIRRPAILPNLARGRPQRFKRFIRTIRPSRRPTFWMKHVLLPHGPYLYLPSGARMRQSSTDPLPGMLTVPGFHDAFLTRHNEQRYLLQLGFVDRLLGRMLRRLQRLDMYDDTLIVVTADHGFAWQVGVETRRSVGISNVAELAPVPLIVKAPRQRRGRVRPEYARTIDIVPTIADVLGLRIGYRVDGRSAFSRAVRRRRSVSLPTRDFSATVRISGRRWEARRQRVIRRRLRQLGSGDWASLYTGIGPNRSLIGRHPEDAARATAAGVEASIAGAGEFRQVRRGAGIVPAQIAGDLRGGRTGERRDIAVAVNGRIEAVGRSFYLAGDPTEHFAVMVPEESLHDGPNRVEVFEVTRAGTLRLLARS